MRTRTILLGNQVLLFVLAYAAWVGAAPLGEVELDLLNAIRDQKAIITTTTLYKDCLALPSAELSDGNMGRIVETWKTSFDTVRRHALANNASFVVRLSQIDISGKNEWPLNTSISNVVALLPRSSLRLGICTGGETACTNWSIPPNANSSSTITVTYALIRNICDYFQPTEAVKKLNAKETQSSHMQSSKRELEQAEELTSKLIVADLQYAALRVFILGHEATHVMLEPYTSPDSPNIYAEMRADIAGILMTAEIPPEQLIDKRMLPLGDKFRQNLRSLICYSGYGSFLSALEKAGFADTFTGNLPATRRREALQRVTRNTGICKHQTAYTNS